MAVPRQDCGHLRFEGFTTAARIFSRSRGFQRKAAAHLSGSFAPGKGMLKTVRQRFKSSACLLRCSHAGSFFVDVLCPSLLGVVMCGSKGVIKIQF
jgi:hypothetical protein